MQLMIQHHETDIVQILSESLIAGFIPIGVLAYILDPSITAAVLLLPFYSPHAYNLIIWPSLALIVLRPRFKSWRLVVAFIFVYGFDEILFNALAVIRFAGNPEVVQFLTFKSWWTFFAIVLIGTTASYLILRPKLKLNLSALMLACFAIIWAWGAGLASLAASNIDSLSLPLLVYALAWELMWQSAYWTFVKFSVFPR
jgi:hypothetical protein